MRIEMWSDIICPICGVTQHRLSRAVDQFEHGDEVEVIHRSFEVHPDLPRGGITQTQLSLDAGMTVEQMNRVLRPLELAAEGEGFGAYRAIDRTLGPTALTHELLAYATDQGRHQHAWAAMFQAHFGAGRQLWTIDQLVDFAGEIGLDPDEARTALESRRYRRRVEGEQNAAVRIGARGTPFIVIDGRYVIGGGADTPSLVGALERAWSERQPLLIAIPPGDDDGAGAVCGVDGCEA